MKLHRFNIIVTLDSGERVAVMSVAHAGQGSRCEILSVKVRPLQRGNTRHQAISRDATPEERTQLVALLADLLK